MSNKTDQHFFASSWLNWNVDTDLERLKKTQKKYDNGKHYKAASCNIYIVPLPIESSYDIDNYIPVVDGVKFLEKVVY